MSPPEQPYLGSIQITFVDQPGSIKVSDTITSGTSYPEFLSDITSLSAEVAHKISGLGRQYASQQGFTLADGGWWFRFVLPQSLGTTNGDVGSCKTEEEPWKLLDCVSAYENMIADVTLSVKWKAAEIQIQHDLQKKRDDQNAEKLKITGSNWRNSSSDYQPSSGEDDTPKVAAASLSEPEKQTDSSKPAGELETVKSTIRNGYDSRISSFEFEGDTGGNANTANVANNDGPAVVEGTNNKYTSQFIYKPPLVVYSPFGRHYRNDSESSTTTMKGVVLAPGNRPHDVIDQSNSLSYPYSPSTYPVQIRAPAVHNAQGPNPTAIPPRVYAPPIDAPFQSQYEHLRQLDQQGVLGEQQQQHPLYGGYQHYGGPHDHEAGMYRQDQGQQDSFGGGFRGRGRGRGNSEGRKGRGAYRHVPGERDDGSWYHHPDAPQNSNARAPRNEHAHQYGSKNQSRPPYSMHAPVQRIYSPSHRHQYPAPTRAQREYQPFPQAQTFVPRDTYADFRENPQIDTNAAQDSGAHSHAAQQRMASSPIYEEFGNPQSSRQGRQWDMPMAPADAATRPTTTPLLGKNRPVVAMPPPVGSFSPPKHKQNSRKAKKGWEHVQKAEGTVEERSRSMEDAVGWNAGTTATELRAERLLEATDANTRASKGKLTSNKNKKKAKKAPVTLPSVPQNMAIDSETHQQASSSSSSSAERAYPRRSERMAARRSL